MNIKVNILIILFFLVASSSTALSNVISADTVWSGEITVEEDILVPEGITLTISSGTKINIIPSDSSRSNPEYLSSLTEITIRGRLEAKGSKDAPVLFHIKEVKVSDSWAGLIIDGGSVHLTSCSIQNAESGIRMIEGRLDLEDSVLSGNQYGLVAQGKKAVLDINNTEIKENDFGVFLFNGAQITGKDNFIRDNKKKDIYSPALLKNYTPSLKEYKEEEKDISGRYGDEVLQGNTVWRGRIEISGLIRVPEGARLVIMPGAVIEFTKKDSNNDGIGENGLMIQGVIIAKGTRERPIIFRSAEKSEGMGDWDSINILNSDGAQNLIEFCQIEDAYRGLHFHFSNVIVNGSVLRNNYRALQFQESVVEIRDNYFYENKGAVQARDSEVLFTKNIIYNNYYGANLFRNVVKARANRILNNLNEGMRIREGLPSIEENLIEGNRQGLMVSDSVRGALDLNVITHNLESGISLKGAGNLEVKGNFIQGNGLNGINIQDSGAVITGNNITGNGERGIGIVSFEGIITENNLIMNGTYAIGVEGSVNVSAPMNWFGKGDAEQMIYDKEDEPARGKVDYRPAKEKPFVFAWPLKDISADVTWHTDTGISENTTVNFGATLVLTPGIRILFSKDAGLDINGRIIAQGRKDERIVFTSVKTGDDSRWDELLLNHADGSVFSYCDFENAAWAIHSHFTNLSISDSRFKNNLGGLRFRSGPVEIRRSLFAENSTGIRAYFGNAMIKENVIVNNETGIFVRERGDGLIIRKNNIYSNTNYNIRSGDFNADDIDARENWWGTQNPAETFFDGRTEEGIGKVIYEPYLKEPVKIELNGSDVGF
ncbi:MAG: right-handed parallel beta-helix repeat-containing protein [Nitrospirae bacterium]|nr:right-handed parallel beta-helix repeat-containing protein [Nitrospirota bacterium]